MRRLTRAAPAKINLGLQVVGRQPDRYHELVTVFQTLELADTVTVEPAATIGGPPSVPGILAEDDLALRAAHLLREETGYHAGARVRVEKHIPMAAGLGGGSSDAAAVLMALNELWDVRARQEGLERLAGVLGADVPFLLGGGTSLATDRGDALREIPAAPPRHVLLVGPDVELATAHVYAELRPSEWSDGTQTSNLAEAIGEGQLPEDLMRNDLTAAAVRLAPEVDEILDALRTAGAQPALMAGSGATCFGLFVDKESARSALERVRSPERWTRLTRFRSAPAD